MPMKGSGSTEYRVIDRWDAGAGWIAYPDEQMQRASHAIVGDVDEETSSARQTQSGDDGGVWLFDPVDAPGIDDLFEEFGDVTGVVVGLARHKRDAAAIAARHGVSVYVPDWMTGVTEEIDAPVERFGRRLGDSGFESFVVVDSSLPSWQEAGFVRRSDGTMVIPESVGTASFFRAPGETLGVHPMLRPLPPRESLSGYDPERLLVGHGEGVLSGASRELERVLDGARRNIPGAYGRALREMVS